MKIKTYPIYTHEYFMAKAIKLAEQAYQENEVPVGALVVANRKTIIGKGYNQTEKLNDVTAHAEILAITAASNFLDAKYLKDCTLYVSLEPCAMCAGAIAWAQIDRIIFGAYDPKKGFSLYKPAIIHPKIDIIGGILGDEAEKIMKSFFKNLRSKN